MKRENQGDRYKILSDEEVIRIFGKERMEQFDRSALEKRLQELTQIPEVGQLDLSSFPDIFLKTGVPVPDLPEIPLLYGERDYEAGQGLLAQIEQHPRIAYEPLTPEKVEEIINSLMIDRSNATVPASEDQEKL